ncbi:thiamine diphosphokinase [Blattabacterium cuenoti]|uniref:thiamine diphosphokinase n=1 Tax=Blattabacterium cuenoti TaxID=1653831 RepID=UPI00293B8DED|nr:thiamine diphosphokinase [Blattabacterium cuenoti]
MNINHRYQGPEIELFLNGNPPIFNKNFYNKNKKIFAVDGAYNYLKKNKIKVDYFSGDFDSFPYLNKGKISVKKCIFETFNQQKTDFEKALNIIFHKGYFNINVWGASGKEQDHFLGNISVALKYKNELSIIFYDKYYSYFFLQKKSNFFVKKNKIISLFPFPKVMGLRTNGLKYSTKYMKMEIGKDIGIRNKSIKEKIEISYKSGNILIFIEK